MNNPDLSLLDREWNTENEIEDKLLLGKRRYMTFGCMCKHISRMIRYRFFPKKEL